MRPAPARKTIDQRAAELGYVGVHELHASALPGRDEFVMVQDYVKNGAALAAAIIEVVRTRKHREGRP